ncbi:hypothetical protein OG302_07415 [Streptomyces sp. NBC_01283]|uniref:hypothetical protein n=1 Tax=Streptomyces sp. NBC_01283 TaxID=2903812 RepID=UPI00352EC3B4|nr:hypothetical protein OG302_07415 [Streptomyces sp. NBC_01283]
MEAEDHRQGACHAGGAHDAYADAARRAAQDGDPFLVDLRLVDLAGLHLVDREECYALLTWTSGRPMRSG